MKIPRRIPTQLSIDLTHGFSSNFGSINIAMSIELDRAKYLNGESVIESIANTVLPDFNSSIENHTQEIN